MTDSTARDAPSEGTKLISTSRCIAYRGAQPPRPITALEQISDALKDPEAFVWLDVLDPKQRDFELLREEFGLHPLAIEDAVKAHERPKIEAYGDSWFLILHAATRVNDVLEIHELAIFAGKQFIVTVRGEPAYPLDEVQRRWESQGEGLRCDSGALLYTILDTVVDGYSPIAEAFEEHVETLEAALLGDSAKTRDVLLEIFVMRKDLSRFRRAVLPVRDILVPIIRGDMQLFPSNEVPYYRDVNDHVTRVIDQMDAARDLINSARDTHIALASNHQNEVFKQLTIVATVFLPLTFVTGFFGQNFGYLTEHITGAASFWWLGIGSEVIAFVGLLAYFRYKRWS